MRSGLPVVLSAALLSCTSPVNVESNPGLGAKVEVLYDQVGVPHVYAQSDADGAYALGYLHSRDRLFQMDFYRRYARGRLAELLGEPNPVKPVVIPLDETQRVIFSSTEHTASGSYRIEDVMAERMPTEAPESQAWLQRYADGVNRYLKDLKAGANGARLPLEYLFVLVGPDDISSWTVQDSLAIGRLQSWTLSSTLQQEIAYGQVALGLLRDAAGGAIFADLVRFAPAVNSFVRSPSSPSSEGGALAPLATLPAKSLAGTAALLASLPRPHGRSESGSNNWAVAPARAAGGRALIANDPHLSLMNPATFHLAHLTTPAREVAGVAFPGSPVIAVGHNGKIGWGATAAVYDVTDLYVEATLDGLVVGASAVPERIQVRLGNPVDFTIQLVPAHGPVIPASIGAGQGISTALSMKWTGQVPTWEMQALLDLGKARSVDEAFAALKSFQVGAQNFVVADVAGNIGHDSHARVPVRPPPPRCIPFAPMPGDGTCEWQGDVPDEELPRVRDPAQGFIATANNDVTGVTAGNDPFSKKPYLYATPDLGFRHQRIVERLAEKSGGYTLDEMTSIQADTTSEFAEAIVPGLVSLLDAQASAARSRGLAAAVDSLCHWGDPVSGPGDPGPWATPTGLAGTDPASPFSTHPALVGRSGAAMLFHAFVPRFARAVLDDDLAGYTASGDSSPLSVDAFLGKLSQQYLAKYVVALVGTATGAPPRVPLQTGTGLCAAPVAGEPRCSKEALDALDETATFLAQAATFGSSTPTDWRWGKLHRVLFSSPLSLAGVTILDEGPYANDGGLYTVDVAGFDWIQDGSQPGTGSFVQAAGPNLRFAAELADGNVRWRAVIPGGQVGHKGDPHYEDQIPAWLANQPGDLPFARSDVEAAAQTKLYFYP
jgi:penicillin amidase